MTHHFSDVSAYT